MRDLPPPPADFVSIQLVWIIDTTSSASNTLWVFAPGADGATSVQLETLAGDFFFTAIPDLLGVLPSNVTLGVLRISSYGTTPNRVAYAPAPNVGALSGGTPLNSALVLTWRTSDPGRGTQGHTFLPLAGDLIDSGRQHLTSIGWSQAQSAARAFAGHVDAIASPDGASCVLAVLSRSDNGFPRPVSQWSPVQFGDASFRVGTLRRRIRARGEFSVPF